MTVSHRSFLLAYAVWLFGTFSYFVPGATWSPVSRFSTTRAIVEHRMFSIDPFAGSTGDRSRREGRWYSDKAPIPALIAVVPYAGFHAFDRLRGTSPRFTAVGSDDFPARRVYVNSSFQRGLYVCTLFTAGAAGVAVGLLLFELLRRRFDRRSALVGSAVTVLATPLLPYSTSFYGHVLAAVFLLGAVVAIDGSGRDPPSGKRLRIAGACLALAPGCEYIVAAPAVVLGAWILLRAPRAERVRVVRDLAIGAALPVAIVSAYHTACFGAPWKTGYSFIQRPQFAAGHASGLLGIHPPTLDGLHGLLLGVRRGLFYIAPIALVAVVAAVAFAIRKRDGATKALLVCAAVLLSLNAGYYMWWGGAATGPRHLVPVLPVLGVGVAALWRTPALKAVVVVAAVVSLANIVALTSVGLEAPEKGNVLTRYAYPMLLSGKVAHISGAANLGVQLGLAPAATLGPWLAWVLLGARLLVRRLEATRGDSAEPLPATARA